MNMPLHLLTLRQPRRPDVQLQILLLAQRLAREVRRRVPDVPIVFLYSLLIVLRFQQGRYEALDGMRVTSGLARALRGVLRRCSLIGPPMGTSTLWTRRVRRRGKLCRDARLERALYVVLRLPRESHRRVHCECVQSAELGENVRLVIFLEDLIDRREIIDLARFEVGGCEPLAIVRSLDLV